MTLDRFLPFLISHNATIIEALFGITLLAVLFLAIRSFLSAKDAPEGGAAGLDMGQLETTLKQILERAGSVPAAGSAGSSEESQRLAVEISNLKTELETKKKQIEEMKAAPAGAAPAAAAEAAPGMSAEDKSALDEKIKELQAKLSEYEIISEDIADLSFYKEQNAKLQKELEGMKAGGAAPAAAAPQAAPAAPAPAPAEPPPPPAEEPAIVGKSNAPTEAAPAAEPPPAPAAAEPAAAADGLAIDDDLMAEFAAAVEKQKTGDEAPAAPPAPSAPAPAAAPAAEAAPAAPQAAEVDLGNIDIDKMVAEAANIKSDGPEVSAEAALGTGVDENKLLQEAAALGGVSAEDKKLMGDFENFVKKDS